PVRGPRTGDDAERYASQPLPLLRPGGAADRELRGDAAVERDCGIAAERARERGLLGDGETERDGREYAGIGGAGQHEQHTAVAERAQGEAAVAVIQVHATALGPQLLRHTA